MRSKELDEQYRLLFELSPDGIATIDIKGVITSVNPAFSKLTGFSKEELVGKHITRVGTIRVRDIPKYLKLFSDIIRGKIAGLIEFSFLRKDGTLRLGEGQVGLIKVDGKTVGIQLILRDITEQKKTENALLESEVRFRELTELLPSCVYELDLDSNVTYVNRSGLELYGYTQEDVDNGLNTSNMMILKDYARAQKIKQKMLSGEEVGIIEYVGIKKDGTRFPTYVHSEIIRRDGKPVGLRGIALDITEFKKIESALKVSEERYRMLLGSISDAVFVINREGQFLYVNDKATDRAQVSQDEMIGRNIIDLFPGIEETIIFKTQQQVFETGEPAVVTDEFTYPNGWKGWIEVHIYPVPEGILCISTDITERKQLEDELKEYSENLKDLVTTRTGELQVSEERLSQFMDSSPDGFFIFDSELNYIEINNVGMTLFSEGIKKEDIIGKNIVEVALDIKETGRYFKYLEVLQTGKPFFIEDIVPHPVFGDVHLTLRAFKVGTHLGIITTDITERKQIEQQLLEAKRLATIGETAGMVGHDLRNPLQAIVNTIYLANVKLEALPNAAEKGELKAYLNTVERQVGYMNKIVSDLLDYARPIHLEIMEISMYQLIQGVLLSLEISETIVVSVSVLKKMKMKIDPVLMRRVFINLITNAIQAMPDGGNLAIKASKKAGEVFISVKDTGVGIRKDDLSKLFQPLFTTKAKGQGFGLPVCKRIIDAHGGDITVKSKVGKGSKFIVKIPLKE